MEKTPIDLTRDQKIARQSSELNALRADQIAEANGEKETEYVEGNRNPKFKIRVLEARGYVHVWTLIKNLSQDQKSFIEETRVVKIHAREFDRRVKDGAFTPYDEVEVVHDPRKGAPKVYEMKPTQLNVDGQVKGTGKSNYAGDQPTAEDLARTKQQIQKEAQRIDAKNDLLKDKETDLAKREADLKARETALAAKETAAPSDTVIAGATLTGPVDASFAQPGTTAAAATPDAGSVTTKTKADKKADEAQK